MTFAAGDRPDHDQGNDRRIGQDVLTQPVDGPLVVAVH